MSTKKGSQTGDQERGERFIHAFELKLNTYER